MSVRRERCLFLIKFMLEKTCSQMYVDPKIARTPHAAYVAVGGWRSMSQTQVCPVWEGLQCCSICDSEQEQPSDGTHFLDQLSSF